MGGFVRVKCECGHEQTVYRKSSTVVYCFGCKSKLVQPKGGEAFIAGKIVKELE